MNNPYCLVGFASGIAGADEHAGDGPLVIQQSRYLADLVQRGMQLEWHGMFKPIVQPSLEIQYILHDECLKLAQQVSALVKKKQPLCVIGGDHTSAIGTWSGVYQSIHEQGDLGLIWVDAHMDSHTPETSNSGRIHGMPLACLLGHGYPELTTILSAKPKVKPEHVCLIGVRSYESGEAEFLKNMGVKVYFMDEVRQRGFDVVWDEAVTQVNNKTYGYGITIDVDAIDPTEAPGVDVPEPNGLFLSELKRGLTKVVHDARLLATEIVEFDPSRDKDAITEKLVIQLIEILAGERK